MSAEMPHTASRFPRSECATAQSAFVAENPGYGAGTPLDDLRAAEYGRLDSLGHV
jgi:hypothetical protein